MRTTQRLALALLAGALVSSACGARLTSGQRAEALSQRGSVTDDGGGGPGTSVQPTAGTTTGGVLSGTSGAVAGPAGGSSGSTSGSTGTTGAGTTGSQAASSDWQKVPPGGNGGATDVGVTADRIVVANVSDVTGAVPGLFEDARFAVQAYVKYFNARYPGGIYGRHLAVQSLDSQLDTGAARAASIQACQETFAGVGSISAFDQGAAPAIAECRSKGGYYPDIRGLATTDQMKAVKNAFPMNAAGTGNYRSFGQYGWVAKTYPEAIKKAVFVYSDGEVTRQNAQQDMLATSTSYGFNWVDEIPVATTETNYGPAAQQIKNDGATYVTFVGAYQQAANLAKQMAQFKFSPQVYMPTVTAYTPNFLGQAGPAVEGGNVYLAMPTSLVEEEASNPELATYHQWLQQVKPGAQPTSLGQFAWGAAALFVQEAIKVGPRLTRGALIAGIEKVHAFSANGMYPAQDVGGRRMSDCVVVVRIRDQKFNRFMPSSGFRCQDGVFNLKAKEKEPGYPGHP